MISFGNKDVSNVYVRNKKITEIYLGTKLVYQPEKKANITNISFESSTFEQTRTNNVFYLNIEADMAIDSSILNNITCYIDGKEVTYDILMSDTIIYSPTVDTINNRIEFTVQINSLDYSIFKVVYKRGQLILQDSIRIRYFYNYITGMQVSREKVPFYREYDGLNTYFRETESITYTLTYRDESEVKYDSLTFKTTGTFDVTLDSSTHTIYIEPYRQYNEFVNGEIQILRAYDSKLIQTISVYKTTNNFIYCSVDDSAPLIVGKENFIPINITWELGVDTGESYPYAYFELPNGTSSNISFTSTHLIYEVPYESYNWEIIELYIQTRPTDSYYDMATYQFDLTKISYIGVDISEYLEVCQTGTTLNDIFINGNGYQFFKKYTDNIYLVEQNLQNQDLSKKVVKATAEEAVDINNITSYSYIGTYNPNKSEYGIYVYDLQYESRKEQIVTLCQYLYTLKEKDNGDLYYQIRSILSSLDVGSRYYDIPLLYKDTPVTEIGENVFYGKDDLVMQFGAIETIGKYAFSHSTSNSYYLPASLKLIDAYAFEDTNITNITYQGTEEKWKQIEIREGNESVLRANITFENQI